MKFLSRVTLDRGRVTSGTFSPIDAADLPASGVTAGSYTLCSITVDSFGRVTAASSGTTPLPVASGGTGTATQFTAGSVVFAGPAGVYAQDNANLFWDDANNRLGIGTVAPSQMLHLFSSAAVSVAAKIEATSASGNAFFDLVGENSNAFCRIAHVSSTGTGTNIFNLPLSVTFRSGTSDTSGLVLAALGGPVRIGTGGTALANERVRVDSAGLVGVNTTAPTSQLQVVAKDSSTNVLILQGPTAEASTGTTVTVVGSSSTLAARTMADETLSWPTGTDASRKARQVFQIYDTAAREALRLEASGSAALIGFLGAAAVARQSGDVGTGLVNLGLFSSASIGSSALVGTTTNDNASAGYVGEYVSAAVASGSAVSLTTATPANVTSVSLTAGDWDVTGVIDYVATGATTSDFKSGVSSTSATFGAQDSFANMPFIATAISDTFGHVLPAVRFSLAATTTVYLVAQSNFSVGAAAAYGTIRARRVR